MNEKSVAKPYPPHPVHRFYKWLDRLPVSMWLFYPALLLLSGFLMHTLGWRTGAIPAGQFNLETFFTFIWLVESIALGHFALLASGPLLDGYRSQITIKDEEFNRLRYEFTTIPSWPGSFFMLMGAAFGVAAARSIIQTSTGLIAAFPLIPISQWALALGIGAMLTYFIIRQLSRIVLIFAQTEVIQLSNLNPIYAFSRYTAILGFGIFMLTAVNALIFAPQNFDNAYASIQTYIFIPFVLAMFYIPLRGINQRIIAEKEHLLEDVNVRIERMHTRLHEAEEKEDYSQALGMRNILTALREEKQDIEKVPTWPWRPGTFATLLSALLLPVILSLVDLILNSILN